MTTKEGWTRLEDCGDCFHKINGVRDHRDHSTTGSSAQVHSGTAHSAHVHVVGDKATMFRQFKNETGQVVYQQARQGEDCRLSLSLRRVTASNIDYEEVRGCDSEDLSSHVNHGGTWLFRYAD
ncbi:hypothetical protein Syun_002289 [Stephania yunnanensis]|uniref:Uncharacterized protein n=1 Tax=Stephania yunnanensis TaxID=152371 RepID=A0AAP0LL67_9MAGN